MIQSGGGASLLAHQCQEKGQVRRVEGTTLQLTGESSLVLTKLDRNDSHMRVYYFSNESAPILAIRASMSLSLKLERVEEK
jgi:hypothetical protein